MTGCPKPHCPWCYAKKLYRRFPHLGNPNFIPKFFPERLKELAKLKKPSKIFVCSCADLFAKETKIGWRSLILKEIRKHPMHTYQLLTKRPQLIPKHHIYPDNVWIGATVNTQEEVWKVNEMKKVKCGVRFVSFEPLLSEIHADLKGIDWVIIGKLTGSKKIPLNPTWVKKIIKKCRKNNVPVFVKDNVEWHKKLQEFPEEKII